MATRKMELTQEQERVLQLLNDPNIDPVVVSVEVLQELVALGLIYRRNDGSFDTTDEGEAVYATLINS